MQKPQPYLRVFPIFRFYGILGLLEMQILSASGFGLYHQQPALMLLAAINISCQPHVVKFSGTNIFQGQTILSTMFILG